MMANDSRDEIDEQVQAALERDAARLPPFAEKPNDRLLGILATTTVARSFWSLLGGKLAFALVGAAIVGSGYYFLSQNQAADTHLNPGGNPHSSSAPTSSVTSPTLPAPPIQPSVISKPQASAPRSAVRMVAKPPAGAPAPVMKLDDSDRTNVPLIRDTTLHTRQ